MNMSTAGQMQISIYHNVVGTSQTLTLDHQSPRPRKISIAQVLPTEVLHQLSLSRYISTKAHIQERSVQPVALLQINDYCYKHAINRAHIQ